MEYLDRDGLATTSVDSFRKQHPYPWLKMPKTLTEQGYQALCENMPPLTMFNKNEGVKRAYGQAPQDRYALHYHPGLTLSQPWMEFIAELQGEEYLSFLRRMLGSESFLLTFEWHYAWQGCSVSPHCDAARKIATHLFYFNPEDWDPSWGGQTLILDGGGRFRTHSAPSFEQLQLVASSEPCGNNSLLFGRTKESWHGVRPLNCPEGTMRRLFKVTVNAMGFQVWWRKLRGKDPDGFPLHAPSPA
jgi:2-oxoglutarate-Fe(II)-dependent oxygenase superfamily protein